MREPHTGHRAIRVSRFFRPEIGIMGGTPATLAMLSVDKARGYVTRALHNGDGVQKIQSLIRLTAAPAWRSFCLLSTSGVYNDRSRTHLALQVNFEIDVDIATLQKEPGIIKTSSNHFSTKKLYD